MNKRLLAFCLSAGLLTLPGAQPLAATGDIHRVAEAELVNLRAGPSNEANVRGRLQQGDEVIELTRDGNWIGVRALATGEEGWVFGDLLEPVARTTLGAEAAPATDAGFRHLSESFDRVIHGIDQDLGYPMVQAVDQPSERELRVVTTEDWLINTSRDAHLMAATAIYQMWKNHQNGERVQVVMVDPQGREYVTIADLDNGPELSVAMR